jgi:hypothetical protein
VLTVDPVEVGVEGAEVEAVDVPPADDADPDELDPDAVVLASGVGPDPVAHAPSESTAATMRTA